MYKPEETTCEDQLMICLQHIKERIAERLEIKANARPSRADWIPLIFYGIHREEEKPLEEVNLSNSIAIFYESAIHHVFYESPKSEFFDFNVEEIDYVDFLGVDDIFINDCDESYTVEENFMFTRGDN